MHNAAFVAAAVVAEHGVMWILDQAGTGGAGLKGIFDPATQLLFMIEGSRSNGRRST